MTTRRGLFGWLAGGATAVVVKPPLRSSEVAAIDRTAQIVMDDHRLWASMHEYERLFDKTGGLPPLPKRLA